MPLDHFSIYVPLGQLEELVAWLLAANQNMGFKEILRPLPHVVGMGENDRPYFWLVGDPEIKATPELKRYWGLQHICFLATDIDSVQKWYDAALKAGGEDNGAPGPRPQYTPDYYGAFVRDPVCGINFEVVVGAQLRILYHDVGWLNMWGFLKEKAETVLEAEDEETGKPMNQLLGFITLDLYECVNSWKVGWVDIAAKNRHSPVCDL